uniref:Uncharacterized protein n=1 Tax=Panstrongylus lignarius TaxID=156445 RepID=A0A224Y2J9_9HEMI
MLDWLVLTVLQVLYFYLIKPFFLIFLSLNLLPNYLTGYIIFPSFLPYPLFLYSIYLSYLPFFLNLLPLLLIFFPDQLIFLLNYQFLRSFVYFPLHSSSTGFLDHL